jgi:DNA polymerase-4
MRTWPDIIVHADMDAFYASVEQLDDPALRGRPVLVGPRSGRGVVLTASYEARPYGVGSAMPMVEALRRCPHAMVVPPRFERYSDVSAQIMAVLRDFSPRVEPLSLDEAFVDMGGAERIFGAPAAMGHAIKSAVFDATAGLTISVGIATTKYVAKVASAHNKPNGLTVIAPGTEADWLAPQDVGRLWGVGPKTRARLIAAGLETIGALAATPVATLEACLGSTGAHLHELALGHDPRRVTPGRRARSMGCDRTLERDVTDPVEIGRHLQRAADRLARRLREKGLTAGGVRLRLKTRDFRLSSRQCTLAAPTDVAGELHRTALAMLSRFPSAGPFRLVGLAVFDLRAPTEAPQLELLVDERARRLEVALDSIAGRWGPAALRRARDLDRSTVLAGAPNLDRVDTDRATDR